jgi:hypothetical protein
MPCKSKCGGGASADKGKAAKPAAGKFDAASSEAYKALNKKFGDGLTLANLNELAISATDVVDGLKPPSGAEKKSTDKLYQWFQNNWSQISPNLDDLDLGGDEEEDGDEGDDDDD